MTCIVGYRDESGIWMGGDSAGVAGWEMDVRTDPKVFLNGPFLMGFTSSFRMGDILRYSFKPPERQVDTNAYMRTTFIDAVRAALGEGGYRRKVNEEERGGGFLVGYEGRLFEVCCDFQVGEPQDPYQAVGCGGATARGAMFAQMPYDIPPRSMIHTALSAAERCSAGVRRPFRILHQGVK